YAIEYRTASVARRCFTREHHRAVVGQPAVQFQNAAVAIDPRLMPPLPARVVEIEALASAAARARPLLEQHASVENACYAVPSRGLAGGRRHIPFTEPEVELAVLG